MTAFLFLKDERVTFFPLKSLRIKSVASCPSSIPDLGAMLFSWAVQFDSVSRVEQNKISKQKLIFFMDILSIS